MIIPNVERLALGQPSAVALGFFDGVHLGHRAVIAQALGHRSQGLVPSVFTFTTKASAPKGKTGYTYLMTAEEKYAYLESIGVERVFCPDFDDFKGLDPEAFVSHLLAEKFQAKVICCGADHRFGKGAAGDVELLCRLCAPSGIQVEIVDPVLLDGQAISSSRIRAAIKDGEPQAAAAMLGRLFGFELRVVHGKELGRRLEFPTVNQQLPEGITQPKEGVYATLAKVDGRLYPAMTNVGPQPTVGSSNVVAETFIHDFAGNLYGTMVTVYLLEYLRPTVRFASVEELRSQLETDARRAKEIGRDYLVAQKP